MICKGGQSAAVTAKECILTMTGLERPTIALGNPATREEKCAPSSGLISPTMATTGGFRTTDVRLKYPQPSLSATRLGASLSM
jgi:hypothetical protein